MTKWQDRERSVRSEFVACERRWLSSVLIVRYKRFPSPTIQGWFHLNSIEQYLLNGYIWTRALWSMGVPLSSLSCFETLTRGIAGYMLTWPVWKVCGTTYRFETKTNGNSEIKWSIKKICQKTPKIAQPGPFKTLCWSLSKKVKAITIKKIPAAKSW